MRKNYLFDLDGTLLPMDTNKFVDLYTAALCKCLVPRTGIDAKILVKAVWKGMESMLRNDGMRLNSDAFWETASRICGRDMTEYAEDFAYFYENDFIAARQSTKMNSYARKCIDLIKDNGGNIIIATNPVFPKEATFQRIAWAGLSPAEFSFITVYDNSYWCKPNLNYYDEICSVCGIVPEESIMVGNDVDEDMCAAHLGFDTFLITDCVINRHGKDTSLLKQGSFSDFYDYLIYDLS